MYEDVVLSVKDKIEVLMSVYENIYDRIKPSI